MNKKSNSQNNYSQQLIDNVWAKADIITGIDSEIFRKDKCGAWIQKNLYGCVKKSLSMGWVIDHIKPINLGGNDLLENLQPLQWENNIQKNAHYPSWSCLVCGSENYNYFI
jgi:5-methylcytosine-specific restriction endonuclease McrA